MTWEEARDLDPAHTVAILPTGAIEAHGPHLPLATDVVIATAMARAGARALAPHGLDSLILPPFASSAATFAACGHAAEDLRAAVRVQTAISARARRPGAIWPRGA